MKQPEHAKAALCAIWNYLIYGRSIKNDAHFIPPGEDNQVIGFWDSGDRKCLHQRLLRIPAGTKNKEGIEYVLAVIEEMKDDNADLIFDVEK